jgi:predicted amidohydrolase
MKVACVQMDVLHCSKQKNLEKALYMALEAVKKRAEIIVFPEVFSTGFCYEDFDYAAENTPSPTLENLACFSEANDCVLIGSVIQKDTEENNFARKESSFKEKANYFAGKEKEMPGSKNSAPY